MIRGILAILLLFALPVLGQENTNQNPFKQLHEELPSPNMYRNASGAPGHAYWQQQADYKMQVELDEKSHTITGKETITYTNNSPDKLSYLWLQLDQNVRSKDSDTKKIRTNKVDDKMSFGTLEYIFNDFDGGFNITRVAKSGGGALPFTINKTMMRVDLPQTLEPGGVFSFDVDWNYTINNRMKGGGRSGYEHFEEEGNTLYTIAQFFPRMCVYSDVDGWQNKQFLGRGEFALVFGDYEVEITVPADHLVAATGELQNPKSVLTSEQRSRLDKARKSTVDPVLIVTQEEAEENEKEGTDKKKTWKFSAKNVRDFGWASSRKFIWDAMAVKQNGNTIMAMSMYPKEGNPLWEQYSTKVVAHTLDSYSKYTFDYPYPVAWSIHTKDIGMEYPMICFNYGRPEKDGTYSKRTKYGMIGVIIHEVGHNYFPMIVNSDERQWTWMDEGLNSYVQYLAQEEWEPNFPSRRGPAPKITRYMGGDKERISPIMTNSESIHQFGNNAYGKPATALNILRESVMGRELFDHAFREYCQRWMFKHPAPADFFRTMEDASGVDLDWFWRGWFYTNDHVDISIDDVQWFRIDTKDPNVEKAIAKTTKEESAKYITDIRNESIETYMDRDPSTIDFYNTHDPFAVSILDERGYENYMANLSDEQLEMLNADLNYYQIDFTKHGGLVMPLILEFSFADGTSEVVRIPAEIWKNGFDSISKIFRFEKEISSVQLDPFVETADVDPSNNAWPAKQEPSRFELFKRRSRGENTMQKDRRAKELEKE